MERQHVQSSNISSVGYNKECQILEIEFYSGGIYQYDSVPLNIYESFMVADSKGKYFFGHIKKLYRFRKIR